MRKAVAMLRFATQPQPRRRLQATVWIFAGGLHLATRGEHGNVVLIGAILIRVSMLQMRRKADLIISQSQWCLLSGSVSLHKTTTRKERPSSKMFIFTTSRPQP